MRVIIDGFVYDSKKAVRIGASIDNMIKSNADISWHATLYMTPRARRFFICGEGGSMTVFRGKKRIIELTAGEAKWWSKKFLKWPEVAHYFESAKQTKTL